MATEKQNCPVCAKICDKSYVLINDQQYHPECFKCSKCDAALGGKPYVQQANNFVCEKCYHDAFSPRCAHCEHTITGPYVEALGKTWCEDHFVCSDCGNGFPDGQFHKIDERPYCKPCYATRTAIDCAACGKVIEDTEAFEALDKKYHKGCFVCEYAGCAIGEGEEFSMYDNKISCKKCLVNLLKLTCSVCSELIPGEYMQIGDQKIHPGCWKCASCGKGLNGGNARLHGGKYVCTGCAQEAGGSESQGSAPNASNGSKDVESATKAVASLAVNQQNIETPANPSAPTAGSSPPPAPAPAAVHTPVSAAANEAVDAAPAAVESLPEGVYVCFTYKVLLGPQESMPAGVNFAKREMHLSDEEFRKVFSCDKAAFGKLPKWRQKQKKQQAKLF